MPTFYVTKYVLTAGILKVTAKVCGDGSFIAFRRSGKHWHDEYAHGKDFYTTLEGANVRAEEMRQARIKSAEKSLDKLRKMGVFKVVDCQ